MSASSGLGPLSAVTTTGSSAIPQIGQAPARTADLRVHRAGVLDALPGGRRPQPRPGRTPRLRRIRLGPPRTGTGSAPNRSRSCGRRVLCGARWCADPPSSRTRDPSRDRWWPPIRGRGGARSCSAFRVLDWGTLDRRRSPCAGRTGGRDAHTRPCCHCYHIPQWGIRRSRIEVAAALRGSPGGQTWELRDRRQWRADRVGGNRSRPSAVTRDGYHHAASRCDRCRGAPTRRSAMGRWWARLRCRRTLPAEPILRHHQ